MKEIDRLAFPADEQYEDAFYAAIVAERRFRTIVAAGPAGDVAGYVLLDLDADPVRLRSIAVHPRHRGSGYGSALVRRAIQETGQELELLVEENNAAAMRLYARLGFEFVENTSGVPRRKAMRFRPVT
ncbi:MAG TPA: GNAT family N-acetyltransferase [Candidatus Baltobacteraceae bacterium]